MIELKNLGKQTPHRLSGADAALLERVPNPMDASSQRVSVIIETDEFTSLCPATGGPDFGTITIEYVPGNWIVESKSLKYYFESFRNEPIFHERVVSKMCTDLAALLDPDWITVGGDFKPRGGLAIRPRASWSRTPDDA